MTKKKNLILLIMLILLSIFIYGCDVNTKDIIPLTMPLEDSIKEIIISKGENYDFLSDELFISKVNELGLSNNFTIGNLDDDNIPEIVVFVERDPDDTNDQGKLQVYKFFGQKYELLDSVDMNYDNNNYQLIIGKLSLTQNGILLSNQVGAHSGITYGYILQDGKLKNILNDNKISLISIYTSNEIKDIDNDGILEFSIYTIDPETEDQSSIGSDKITLWYKWDGVDSGNLIDIDRVPGEASTKMITMERGNTNVDFYDDDFLPYLNDHLAEYDKFQLTDLVMKYIIMLEENIESRSLKLNNLFSKYQSVNSYDYLDKKYGLSLERLNDLEYIKREKIFQTEPDLKEYLIKNLEMGYKVEVIKNKYFYTINNQNLLNKFGDYFTKEYRDYLNIKTKYPNESLSNGETHVISQDKLAERIVEVEYFRITYPYSSFINEVNNVYKKYVLNFIYGNENAPNYDIENRFAEKSLAVFQNNINKYPETHFADILKEFINSITPNLNILTDEIRKKIDNLIL